MTRVLMLIAVALLAGAPAFADMDVEMEKREAAKREAAKQAEAAKQREMQQMKNDAAARANAAMNKHLTDAQRKALGMPPTGGPAPK